MYTITILLTKTKITAFKAKFLVTTTSGVPRGGVGGVWGVQTPPKILKALQNFAKLNPICENC